MAGPCLIPWRAVSETRRASQPATIHSMASAGFIHSPMSAASMVRCPMPAAGAGSGSKDTGGKSDKDGKDNGKNRPDPNVKARAEGQSQFDYLQRLGDRVRQLDAQLRLQGDRGIEAVGVLGSDLYDKLLVLQALRPLLPEARFFTTDFDALLLHPDEQKATGNLLVGSGFGLQLRPDVQGTIPPFRSNYQTAEFLAARVAIHSDNAPNPCWSSSPLMFEIGRSREFQFAEMVPPASDECKQDLRDCEGDAPKGRPADACTSARERSPTHRSQRLHERVDQLSPDPTGRHGDAAATPSACFMGTGERRTVRRTWPRRHSSGRSETEGAILACRTRAAAILAVHVGPCCAGPRHHRRDCPHHDRARRRLADARRPAHPAARRRQSLADYFLAARDAVSVHLAAAVQPGQARRQHEGDRAGIAPR